MKISGLEKCILALTLAFLLFTVGYFLGQNNNTEPYTISAQTMWTEEVGAGAEEESAPADIEQININTASVDELQTLSGIGQVRAEAIVADREENGPFRFPEDLTRVSGIGEGTLAEILDYITVG